MKIKLGAISGLLRPVLRSKLHCNGMSLLLCKNGFKGEKFMYIKEFVEKYNAIATDRLKEDYLKDNLHIKTYLPFLTKVTLADKLAKVTMLDKDTGNVNVKSDVNYLLFCRMVVEQYTDLQVETEGFYEEYDLLNESGLLDKIMQMIHEKEIAEFNTICDMKKSDLLQNKYENHAFIADQVKRFGTLIGITLKPVLEKISEQIENMSEEDVEKFTNKFEKLLKRVK